MPPRGGSESNCNGRPLARRLRSMFAAYAAPASAANDADKGAARPVKLKVDLMSMFAGLFQKGLETPPKKS